MEAKKRLWKTLQWHDPSEMLEADRVEELRRLLDVSDPLTMVLPPPVRKMRIEELVGGYVPLPDTLVEENHPELIKRARVRFPR